jgi:hypothetical protein
MIANYPPAPFPIPGPPPFAASAAGMTLLPCTVTVVGGKGACVAAGIQA